MKKILLILSVIICSIGMINAQEAAEPQALLNDITTTITKDGGVIKEKTTGKAWTIKCVRNGKKPNGAVSYSFSCGASTATAQSGPRPDDLARAIIKIVNKEGGDILDPEALKKAALEIATSVDKKDDKSDRSRFKVNSKSKTVTY